MPKLLSRSGFIGLLFFAACSELTGALPVSAQVAGDGTLSTRVNSNDGQNFTIDQGDRSGGNLFHSFREFSVPTGGSVFFDQALDVQNIFSRVTGGSISTIDGLIRANGTANLFLLNPNGIILGPNARLNLGGSFVASTADRLRFADGSLFVAQSPETSSLLTVSAPIGLQMGRTPGRIQVNGLGNPEIVPTTNLGLAIAPGRTVALVGGNVSLQGGIVTAIAGRVEVGSVRAGEVSLQPTPTGLRLGYEAVSEFGDVQLRDRSALWSPDPLGNPFGGIQVQANQIRLDNSQITTATLGAAPGGGIEIAARRSLSLGGVGPVFPFSSAIASQVNTDATGRGGDIRITTPRLIIQDGALIQSATLGAGHTGDIQVETDLLRITGFSPLSQNPALGEAALLLFNNRIASETFGAGSTGNIRVAARRVELQQGGQVRSLIAPGATGNSGTIRVTVAETLTAREAYPLNPLVNSGVSALNFGTGNSAGITLRSDRLILHEGAMIFSFNQGTGQGGNVTVNVRDRIAASRTNPRFPAVSSGINASTLGTGNGGNVDIRTGHLYLAQGAEAATYVLSQLNGVTFPGAGTGNAGDLTIAAGQSVAVIGTNPLIANRPSVINSLTLGSGDAGNVTVSARRIRVLAGGSLASGVLPSNSLIGAAIAGAGTGDGGDIRVTATEMIEVSGIKDFENSDIGTYTLGAGDAGRLFLQTPRLIVSDGAGVASATLGSGNAGQLQINADDILIQGVARNGSPARISADAPVAGTAFRRAYLLPPIPTGNTGTVTIRTERLRLRNGGEITVTHAGLGNAGRLSIAADRIELDTASQIGAATASGTGGDINLRIQERLVLRDRATISATAGGRGNGGNLNLAVPFIITRNNSDVIANAIAGRGGSIQIQTQGILGSQFRDRRTAESDITASSQFGVDGTVEITTPQVEPEAGLVELPTELLDANQQVAAFCTPEHLNSFVITGRGGIPSSPQQPQLDRPWSDLRDLSRFSDAALQSQTAAARLPAGLQLEATTWQRNRQGQIELIGVTSTSDRQFPSVACAQSLP